MLTLPAGCKLMACFVVVFYYYYFNFFFYLVMTLFKDGETPSGPAWRRGGGGSGGGGIITGWAYTSPAALRRTRSHVRPPEGAASGEFKKKKNEASKGPLPDSESRAGPRTPPPKIFQLYLLSVRCQNSELRKFFFCDVGGRKMHLHPPPK